MQAMSPPESHIAELLDSDSPDLSDIFEHLYPELKKLAMARLASLAPGRTVTPTVLVHEAYMKLVKSESLDLKSRRYFFACAGRVMHDVLIDHLRAGNAAKRGGQLLKVTFSEELSVANPERGLLDLERALQELEQIDQQQRELVDMRFFAGLTLKDISELTDTPYRTVQRRWERARAFLHLRLDSA